MMSWGKKCGNPIYNIYIYIIYIYIYIIYTYYIHIYIYTYIHIYIYILQFAMTQVESTEFDQPLFQWPMGQASDVVFWPEILDVNLLNMDQTNQTKQTNQTEHALIRTELLSAFISSPPASSVPRLSGKSVIEFLDFSQRSLSSGKVTSDRLVVYDSCATQLHVMKTLPHPNPISVFKLSQSHEYLWMFKQFVIGICASVLTQQLCLKCGSPLSLWLLTILTRLLVHY